MIGWLLSLALAYGIGGLLAAAGVVLSLLYTGSALATTAIGTLIPILRDAGELRTRFGTYLLAAGAVGEFGPILLITLVLSTHAAASRGADPRRASCCWRCLLAVARGPIGSARLRGDRAHPRGLGQLAVRIAVVLVFGSSRSPATSASTCCSAASSPASSSARRSVAARSPSSSRS